jgi:hypothetical protein
MPTPPLPSFLRQVGLAKEPSWATVTAPTTADQFVPIMNAKYEDVIESVLIQPFVSRASLDQNFAQGFRYGKYSFETFAYPDVAGNLLMGIMGSDGWASASTHPLTVLNTALPPSYSIQDFYGLSGTHTRSFNGSYCESIQLSAATAGPVKMTCSYLGKFGALVAKPTGTYTTLQPVIPWQGALTLNSALSTTLIQFDLTLKRSVEGIQAMGVQDISAAFSGSLEVTGKMVFVPTDDTEYLLYSNTGQAQFPLSLVFTSGSNTITISCTKTNFETPTTLDMGPYLKTAVSFRAIDNATDAGATKITIVGGKAGSAY